jgi:hypothetical protein
VEKSGKSLKRSGLFSTGTGLENSLDACGKKASRPLKIGILGQKILDPCGEILYNAFCM